MSVVLGTGALIALERDERRMWIRLKAAQVAREVPITHAGVLGQVWRGGAHQARLAQALEGVDVIAIDEDLGRAAGVLPGRAGLADVIAAALVLLASDGDDMVTDDHHDFEQLARAVGRHVELINP